MRYTFTAEHVFVLSSVMIGEKMLKKAIFALLEKDYRTFAACFTEDCDYADFCPCLNGKRNYYVHGSPSLEMFFHQRLVSHRFEIAEPLVENEREASFFCTYDNGPYVYARMVAERFGDDGRIEKAVVHPA